MEIKVNGFSVSEVDNPFKELTFSKIRRFQKDFIENVDKYDILFLSAPTGAGKTLCFEYLCKKNPPVLLVYPTTALMTDQERQLKEHGLKVFRLDSNSIGDVRGYARSRRLIALFQRHEIIITNPDIISAILHHMYINPEDDLLRIFRYFHYIAYDEFHVYKELELSDILLQILLFISLSKAKVVLSSATPSTEFINVLRDIKPDCQINIIEEKGCKEGSLVRYDTKVYISNEKFKDKVKELIKLCIEKNLKTLVMCNSIIFVRDLYNSLVHEGYEKYITKETGDETRGIIKADYSKLIIIATSQKAEIGLDLPFDVIIMDIAPDLQSFIQRFGRVSRKMDGIAYIFVKNLFNIENKIEYHKFIEIIREYFLEKNLSEKILKSILELRAYLILDRYSKEFELLSRVFSKVDTNKYYRFFKEIDNSKEELSKLRSSNKDLDDVIKFLNDYKNGLSLLRGLTLTAKIKYQRGEEWTFTSYDILHSLNNYKVQISADYITLLEPSDDDMIHSIFYNGEPYDFYNFDKQLKDKILKCWKMLEEFELVKKDGRYILQELFYVDLKRVIIPEKVKLKDGKEIDLKNYLKDTSISLNAMPNPNNII